MSIVLKNKQILYLFLSSFAVLFTGMGLFPILPLYVSEFKASNSIIGLYYAEIYSAFALGPVAAGWLIARFSKRSVLIGGSLVGIPALYFLGMANSLVEVFALTSLIWFSGGVVLALVSILTGLHSDASSRGKAYSLMGMAAPLGSLAGGASVGRLVGWQGYAGMFAVLAVTWSVIPLVGWLLLKEPALEKARLSSRQLSSRQLSSRQQSSRQPKSPAGQSTKLGREFTHLLVIAFAGSMVVNLGRLGSSLAMKSAHYSAEAISNVALISGLVAIPLLFAMGAVSDRLGHKHFLGISFLVMASSALILTGASAQWQYALVGILNMLVSSASGAMTQALTGEIVPAGALDRGLSWLNALVSTASIVIFAVGGLLFDLSGLAVVFGVAALAAVGVSAAVEVFIRPAAQPVPSTQPCLIPETCGSK